MEEQWIELAEYESLCLSSNKLQEKTPQLLEGLYKVSVV